MPGGGCRERTCSKKAPLYALPIKIEDDEAATFRSVRMLPYLTTFFRETSFQGFPAIIKQPGIIRRALWVAFMILSGCGLIWEMQVFIEKITEWKATTSVSYERRTQLFFPAVTFCSVNAVNSVVAGDVVTSGGSAGTGGTPQQSSGAPSGGQPPTGPQSGSLLSAPTGSQSGSLPSPSGSQSGNLPPQTGSTSRPPPGRKKRQIGGQPPRQSLAATKSPSKGKKAVPISVENVYRLMENVYNQDPNKREAAGQQKCDLILDCLYNAEGCSIMNEFSVWHWNPYYGNCWTFNPGLKRSESPSPRDADLWKVKVGAPMTDGGVKKATSPGDMYGLKLLLSTDASHYASVTTSAGWRIVIHNQTEMPFPESEGVFVAPGTSTRIGINLKYHEQLGIVDHVIYQAPYSDCVDTMKMSTEETKRRNAYSNLLEIAYSKLGCLNTCYQANVMKTCKCYDYSYPSTGPAFDYVATQACSYHNDLQCKPTSPSPKSNIKQDSFPGNCKQGVRDLFVSNSENLNCSCPDSCKAYSYDVSISTLRWPIVDKKALGRICAELYGYLSSVANKSSTSCSGPSLLWDSQDAIVSSLKACADNTDANFDSLANFVIATSFAEVYIYFKSFDYESVVESELMEMPDLVAYLGGIVGLFFGFTMLTLCEFFFLAVDLIGIAFVMGYDRFIRQRNNAAVQPLQRR